MNCSMPCAARHVLAVAALAAVALAPLAARSQNVPFRRGDASADGQIDIGDPVRVLFRTFVGDVALPCEDAADSNDDGAIDVSDAVHGLTYLFLNGAPPPAPFAACGADPTTDTLGCASFDPCASGGIHVTGQTAFLTPMNGSSLDRGAGDVLFGADGAEGGAPQPAEPQGEPSPSENPERTVEESDLYKIIGETIYVLNRYRGLQVIDLADPAQPELVASLPFFGYPDEMYVRDDRAFIFVRDYYRFSVEEEDGVPSVTPYYGSLLHVVDVSAPRSPELLRTIDILGLYQDSRFVGDILYAVSRRVSSYYDSAEPATRVVAVDASDPDRVEPVDVIEIASDGWAHHVHVERDALFVGQTRYDSAIRNYRTAVRHVDISDPAGRIVPRGEGEIRGYLPDRWSMDGEGDTFRIATDERWRSGKVHLTTFSIADPDRWTQLGQYTLDIDETLTAARFDGPRGYLVTYRNIDPLFTFDLSDPRRPRLLGELEMTGWLDFIVPMDDRLVALGHEDLVDPETGRRDIRLAVSLIDVGALERPELLSRVVVGASWGRVPGQRDDFEKVFKVLSDEGLILFPFSSWNPETFRQENGVQLVDLDRDTLQKRGLIDGGGRVERGISHEDNRVFTLSTETFQSVDVSDRDAPEITGSIELSRNVQELAVLPDGEHLVQLVGDWYRGDAELVVTPRDTPNTIEPVSRFPLPAPYGRIFTHGSFVYVASVVDVEVDIESEEGEVQRRTESRTHVQVVDLSDPAAPRARGSLVLPTLVWPSYRGWYWGWGDEVVQVDGTTLAFHPNRYIFWDCLACGAFGPWVGGGLSHQIFVVDLADPDTPNLASTIETGSEDWFWGLKAFDGTIYASSYRYEPTADTSRSWARYYLHRFDVSDPANPVTYKPVNIPGMFLEARDGGEVIFTHENWWKSGAQESTNVFYSLRLRDDVAELRSQVELPGYTSGFGFDGDTAVTVGRRSFQERQPDGTTRWRSEQTLYTIDASNPELLRLAGRAGVPGNNGYLREVDAGRAFLGTAGGLFSYRVDDVDEPTFERFFRTQGWVQDIVVDGDRAFVPSGSWGVQTLELGSR